jgi:hypothetical protein
MKQYFSFLWQRVNNSQLIVFRILFGFVMAGECVYNITSGTVKLLYIDITHNFAFIGFEWLRILHGSGMYAYFMLMMICALFVAAGFFYRFSSLLLALLWTGFYLSHKTHYNNHHYLIFLSCWIMVFMPAHRRFSTDVKLGFVKPLNHCFSWQIYLFVFQVACVYLFAGIAKLNRDWFHAIPLKFWLPMKSGLPITGWLMKNPLLPWLVSYGGLVFDLAVVPGLLNKATRKYFFVALVIFHAFNGYVFSIGSFPFLSVSLAVFFFSAELFDKVVPQEARAIQLQSLLNTKRSAVYSFAIVGYAVIQLWLPIRHWFIPGPVNWTEEGHRLSWRMMLRSKLGTATFKVVNKNNDSTWYVPFSSLVHQSQVTQVASLPDLTWQAAQHVKEKCNKQGMNVAIYSYNHVRLNYHPPRLLVDTSTDLANTRWKTWGHNNWILFDR